MHAYYVWVNDLLYRAQSLWERIVDAVPGGAELEPQFKTGSWPGHTHTCNNTHVKCTGVYCA
jgi:hypothetical protein